MWLSFIAAMTGTAGLLVIAQGGPAPRLDGLSLSALDSSPTGASLEAALRTRVELDRSRWQAIVIHHSGSPAGSPASIEAEHIKLNYRGLGHHFVIGNGLGMAGGAVHVGHRWLEQLPGAHAAGPDGDYFNRHAISICLVGDGDRRAFSRVQLQRLAALVEVLRSELGIPADRVYLHSDIAPVSDPGRLFPAESLADLLATAR